MLTKMQSIYVGAGEQLPYHYATATAQADLRRLCQLARVKRYLAIRLIRSGVTAKRPQVVRAKQPRRVIGTTRKAVPAIAN